jgi:hypothetical protein
MGNIRYLKEYLLVALNLYTYLIPLVTKNSLDRLIVLIIYGLILTCAKKLLTRYSTLAILVIGKLTFPLLTHLNEKKNYFDFLCKN